MRGVAWALWLLGGSPAAQAELELGPAAEQVVDVRTAEGEDVATVVVRPELGVRIGLPAGVYTLVDRGGAVLGTATLEAGEHEHVALPGEGEGEAATRRDARLPLHAEEAGTRDRVTMPEGRAGEPEATPGEPTGGRNPPRPRSSEWRPIVAPIVSAAVPGAGQAVNRQGGKALAVFIGVAGLAVGSAVLWRVDWPREGLARGSNGTAAPIELLRLWSFSGMTTAAGLLYVGQILDALAVARGRPVRPDPAARFSLSFSRASTVGARAGQPSHALFDDWTLALLVRLHPRVTFGVADLGIATARDGGAVLQAGLRTMARLWMPGRFELLAGGGGFVQFGATSRTGREHPEGHVGGVLYAQLEGRWFLLDRWSLGVAPRVSLPLTDRRYPRGGTLPRLATTFELVASVGVQF